MDNITVEGYKLLSSTINQTVLAETALITASIAIYEKLVKNQSKAIKLVIRTTWIFFALSILAGLFAGHHISYYITSHPTEDVYKTFISIAAEIHFFFFLSGIISIIVFGWKSTKEPTNENKNHTVTIKIATLDELGTLSNAWTLTAKALLFKQLNSSYSTEIFNENLKELIKSNNVWIMTENNLFIGWLAVLPSDNPDEKRTSNLFYFINSENENKIYNSYIKEKLADFQKTSIKFNQVAAE